MNQSVFFPFHAPFTGFRATIVSAKTAPPMFLLLPLSLAPDPLYDKERPRILFFFSGFAWPFVHPGRVSWVYGRRDYGFLSSQSALLSFPVPLPSGGHFFFLFPNFTFILLRSGNSCFQLLVCLFSVHQLYFWLALFPFFFFHYLRLRFRVCLFLCPTINFRPVP